MQKLIIIRYGEMTLKKDNYRFFLNKLKDSFKSRFKGIALEYNLDKYRGYLYYDEALEEKVIDNLQTISGLYSYSVCEKAPKDLDSVSLKGIELLKKETFSTYKLETKRADKTYPLTSIDISKEVAKRIVPKFPDKKVDVHNPDIVLNIDWRFDGAYLYTKEVKLIGGYPQLTASSTLALLSGGIDSPVSLYLMLKKGMHVEALYFESPPHTSQDALQKVISLAERLASYTSSLTLTLHTISVTKIQEAILDYCDNKYLVTLLRRQMIRLSGVLRKVRKLSSLTTGESIGQVASQTVEGMKSLENLSDAIIFRPLLTYDKEEIIKISRTIKTYDISVLPYEDCCTVFVPVHPVIKPVLSDIVNEEKKLDLDALISEAFKTLKSYTVKVGERINVYLNGNK